MFFCSPEIRLRAAHERRRSDHGLASRRAEKEAEVLVQHNNIISELMKRLLLVQILLSFKFGFSYKIQSDDGIVVHYLNRAVPSKSCMLTKKSSRGAKTM